MNTNETTTTMYRIDLLGKPENLAKVKQAIWGDEEPAELNPEMIFPMDEGNKNAAQTVREGWIKFVWGGVTTYRDFRILVNRPTELAFLIKADSASLGFIPWELETNCIKAKVACSIFFASEKRGTGTGYISTDLGARCYPDGGEDAIDTYEALWVRV